MDASEKSPDTGAVQQLEPDLRCVLAPNASPMTYWGTNTYLLGQHEVAVIGEVLPGAAHDVRRVFPWRQANPSRARRDALGA